MEYDFRTRSGQYDAQNPMYRTATSSSSSSAPHSTHPIPMYGPSLYPRVGQPAHNVVAPVSRPSPHHHTSSSSSGLGIRVAIKPEYRITPPPQMSPQGGDIPRSNFHFDFEFERKVIAESEKEIQNWGRLGLENLPSRPTESTSSSGSGGDPVVSKYISMGLNREAVSLAVANYGDDPTKVQGFVKGYTLLQEMGFASSKFAEVLVMYDNDTDKAIAHILSNSS